jgi:predicted RNA-binding Zn ribbon-like protein
MSIASDAQGSVPDPASERFTAAPAPRSLQRVQSFLNTRSAGLPVEPDLLARPSSANKWLRTFEWPTTPRLTADELTSLRELRQSLQKLVEAGHSPAEKESQLDFAPHLANLCWTMILEDGQLALSAEGRGWRQVAGALLSDIFVAQQHDLWQRLKACREPLCTVIFYDSSKNQSRIWHNTLECGNRTNLRASRARRRPDARGTGPTRSEN